MTNHLIGLAMLFLLICSTGCIEDQARVAIPAQTQTEPPIQIQQAPAETDPELENLLAFLAVDKTDEITYNMDHHHGVDYYVCSGFTRTLATNAKDQGIILGGISLRNTPTVGRQTKYYHAMNYAIVDNSFVIIEPQTDAIFYLDLITKYHGGAYRYISINQNAQMMTNYGKGRETVDIDLYGDINEAQLIASFPPQ